jgi:hypothetical protein
MEPPMAVSELQIMTAIAAKVTSNIRIVIISPPRPPTSTGGCGDPLNITHGSVSNPEGT